ncbi:hypothetical protein L7F22_057674 [Adiantum nelumboides]|nr:hypothetical protein [Adiantum nelumboides]
MTITAASHNVAEGSVSTSKLPSVADLARRSSQRTRLLFSSVPDAGEDPLFPSASSSSSSSSSLYSAGGYESVVKERLASKIASEYKDAQTLPQALLAQQAGVGPSRPGAAGQKRKATADESSGTLTESYIDDLDRAARGNVNTPTSSSAAESTAANGQLSSGATILPSSVEAIEGHQRTPWVGPVCGGGAGQQWFATGAGDRMIKIWDLASGELKLSLTGHISTVRGLAVSSRHPYLFSCGEDKMVKCWDLETNKVIRQYHGSLSGIYSLALHPTLDILVTAGRDAVARVWDMRTKAQIHVLAGHRGTIANVQCQESDPQVITGSMDSTVRLWDLAAGKSLTTLTHHKKSVRALALHPRDFSFASGSAGGRNIKTWRFPEGTLLNNATHDSIVNTLSVNADGVLFSGADNGTFRFFDYDTAVPFQSGEDVPQPGSLDAEAGIFCSTFDHTGSRLITGGADKSEHGPKLPLFPFYLTDLSLCFCHSLAAIKMYKETS